ncbi:MAG TPA: translation initiation factor IF-1 [Chloroflexota bacterium]|jgi:translation initiation factor IF-1|nr:translation initiation factor IF-1 [Chloroflexota bacterium]
MAVSDQGDVVVGAVTEVLPNLMYRVELATGAKVLAHLGPEVRLNLPRIIPGDRVTIRLSPYDSSRGAITARER